MENVIAVISPNNQTVSAVTETNDYIVSASFQNNNTEVTATLSETIQEVSATVSNNLYQVTAVISEALSGANIDHIELELKMTSSLFRYKEFTYNVSGDISLQEIWDSSLKATKYYTITYTYTLGDLVNIEVERVSDGFTYNKEFEYDLQGNLTTININ